MKQAATARRSSGQKAKTNSSKKQAPSSGRSNSRSSSGNQRSTSNNSSFGNSRSSNSGPRSSSGRSAKSQDSARASVMRPSSGTMERGVSSSSAGLSSARSFQSGSGQYFEKFFMDQLKDIYYAEQKIVQSLPKMQEAATTDELKEAFEDHLYQTQRHVRRLEKVFNALGLRPEGKKCEAIEGIIKEAETIISETEENTMTRDAALIMAAKKVEHYEIATYGGLVQMAITMGQYEVAEILDKTLMEEEDTDLLLTEIAECEINVMAEFEGIGAEEEEMEEGEDEEELQ
jgi:ferritin-like metal-binding protein YciE